MNWIKSRGLLAGLVGSMLAAGALAAGAQVRVLALFPGKAMVSVDGSNHVLSAGQTGADGVRLISATSKQAVIEVDGQRDTYRLGDHIGGSYAQPERAEARIIRNAQGAFVASGAINGKGVRMMVDTGATMVAMSSREAARLGIDYQQDGEHAMVSTASGNVPAFGLVLDLVRIGDIEQRNVRAVVIEGSHPQMVLLGQTFLSRVKIENEGNLMLLQAQF